MLNFPGLQTSILRRLSGSSRRSSPVVPQSQRRMKSSFREILQTISSTSSRRSGLRWDRCRKSSCQSNVLYFFLQQIPRVESWSWVIFRLHEQRSMSHLVWGCRQKEVPLVFYLIFHSKGTFILKNFWILSHTPIYYLTPVQFQVHSPQSPVVKHLWWLNPKLTTLIKTQREPLSSFS